MLLAVGLEREDFQLGEIFLASEVALYLKTRLADGERFYSSRADVHPGLSRVGFAASRN